MPFDLIRLTETSGEIRSQTILDREIRSNFDFSIEATDAGLPNSKTSRFDFSIRIIDVNDNAPKFRWFQTNLTVNEDFPVGREILRAEADDQDENENAVVVYSILDDKSNFFRIDEKNGIVRTRKNFDRKVQSQHVFQIEAKDRGSKISSLFYAFDRNVFSFGKFFQERRLWQRERRFSSRSRRRTSFRHVVKSTETEEIYRSEKTFNERLF